MLNRTGGVLVAVLLFLCGCASTDEARFSGGAGYRTFDFDPSTPYAEYQRTVSGIVGENWGYLFENDDTYRGLDRSRIDFIVSAHTPTDKPPRGCDDYSGPPRGMVLLHGLYDSPYLMHDLESFFNRQCFHTRSILLPGHGTRPGSLLDVDWKEWREAVDYAVMSLADETEGDVYITGFSTGGALAIHKALDDPRHVKGVFLFAPALKFRSLFPNLLSLLSIKWLPKQIFDDRDMIKYESATVNSAVQVDDLIDSVEEKMDALGPLGVPVMVVVSRNDATLNTEKTLEWYEQGRFGSQSRMIMYKPMVDGDECKASDMRLGNDRASGIVELNSCFVYKDEETETEYYIADYSHMALTLKPDDCHYGLRGGKEEYRYCHHYFLGCESHERKRELCESGSSEQVCLGERSSIGGEDYAYCRKNDRAVRRLTSNPRFGELEDYLAGFIREYID